MFQNLPHYRLRKRIKNYIAYLEGGEWQSDAGEEESNPIVMVVYPNLVELIYCKRITRSLLKEKWDEAIRLWFTTVEKLKTRGMTGKIWEEVGAPEDQED